MSDNTLGMNNASQQVSLIRNLRDIRKNRGMTLKDVADIMGVEYETALHFEKGGSNFTAATLRKYAKAIGARLQLSAVPDDPGR